MTDEDVAATLKEIREEARAAQRTAKPVVPAVDAPAPAESRSPQPLPPHDRKARLRHLARPLLMRAGHWINQPLGERLVALERTFGQAINELRSQTVSQEQRLRALTVSQEQRIRQLEEEHVRLRQLILQHEEAIQVFERARRGLQRRIEELEGHDRQGAPKRTT